MATVRDVETRVDDLEKSYLDFKARMETLVMLGKWAAGFTAATLVTLIFQTISIAHSAGRLEADVAHQSREISRLNDKVDNQNRESNEKFDKLSKQIEQLHADLRKPKVP